ncbi:MAG: hypothetical protein ACXWQO_09175 [Bdellovibrionota bacterium]
MIFTLLFLLSANAQAADCLKVVPYKSLGELTIGATPPPNFPFQSEDIHQDQSWDNGGGYRFNRDDKGKIVFIQRPLRDKECFLINGKKFVNDFSMNKARKAFPKCEFEARTGANVLQCNGFEIVQGRDTFRLDVSHWNIASVKKQRIEDMSRSLMSRETEKYPWIVRKAK